MELPGGNRIAVWVAPNVEHYEYLPPSNPYNRNSFPRTPHPDVLNYAWHDYGNRIALWRTFDLLDEFGIRGSVSLNAAVFDHFPQLAEAMASRHWDFMSHGVYNTRFVYGLSEDEERELIADVIDTVKRHTGQMISGWLGPGLTTTLNTPDLLAEAGVKYWVDYFHEDQPFPLYVRKGRLITIPYSFELNDLVVCGLRHQSAESFGRMIKDQFDRLYDEGSQGPRVMCIPTHPYVIDAPSRQKYLRDAFSYIYGHSRVWNTTGAEIADWYYAECYEPMMNALAATRVRG